MDHTLYIFITLYFIITYYFSKKMTKECRESISQWTEAQAEDIQLNPVVRLHCKSFIQKFCSVSFILLFK